MSPRFSPRIAFALALSVSLAALAPGAARAAWPPDPGIGAVQVIGGAGDQFGQLCVSDGAGGAIYVWEDYSTGDINLFAQRVSATGAVLWAPGGVPVCTQAGTQSYETACSDGSGGIIIAWSDYRSLAGDADIYAQRINAAGVVQWTVNGVPLSVQPNDQVYENICSDGAGGAIVMWEDHRNSLRADIYGQRVNAAGTPQWLANGRQLAVSAAFFSLTDVHPVADGAGGAIFGYIDPGGSSGQVIGGRVNAAGTSLWSGLAILSSFGSQPQRLSMVADGAGGAIAVWEEHWVSTFDIAGQRVSSGGTNLWGSGELMICNASGYQQHPVVAPDGSGGGVVAWEDARSISNYQIYAQRIGANGGPLWGTNGEQVRYTSGVDQNYPRIAADGAGGGIVVFQEVGPLGATDIYAQRVVGSGSLYWGSGTAVCTAAQNQLYPFLTTDGAQGAIMGWYDVRNLNGDVYGQRVESFGYLGNPEASGLSVKDVKFDQGGEVKVGWNASYLDAGPYYSVYDYRLWRSVPAAASALPAAGMASAQRANRPVTTDADVAAKGGTYLAASSYLWEFIAEEPAAGLSAYSLVAPTAADSVAGGNPRTVFMVETRTNGYVGSPHWFSAPDSGYSVDNLPPAMPAPFTGQYSAGTATLHWNRNIEADLGGYRLYRGGSASFTPSSANLIASPPDTGYADAAGAPYYYKLTAVDVHGNESPAATLLPGGVLDAGETAFELWFAAPAPNPAVNLTTLRWSLAAPGQVRLSLYDASGRRVRTLVSESRAAGPGAAAWDLRDQAGHGVGAGLYFARFEAGGSVMVRRIVVER